MAERADESRQSDPKDAPDGESSDDGVDVSLIRWFLSLSPADRLRTVQNYATSIQRLRQERDDPQPG